MRVIAEGEYRYNCTLDVSRFIRFAFGGILHQQVL